MSRVRLYLAIFVTSVITTLPNVARANIPIPSLIGFTPPFFLPLWMVAALFVAVVVIETTVLKLLLRQKFLKCLYATIIANLVSSIVGLLLSGPSFLVILPLLAAWLTGAVNPKTKSWNKKALLFISIPTVAVFAWVLLTSPSARGLEYWALYGSLLPAYVVSVFVEFAVLTKMLYGNGRLFQWTALVNIPSYAMLFALMVALPINPKENPLITIDYLYTNAESFARHDKPEKALEMLDMLQEHYTSDLDNDAFLLTRELITADILARRGYDREARIIVERAKKVEYKPSLWDKEVEARIREIEKLLDN